MNRAVFLYVGVLLTVLLSFTGLVSIPEKQLGGLQPLVDADGTQYPVPPTGMVAEGRGVYIADGCIYCHSQQVRPEGFGDDIERGWGTRRTVARDHIYDSPPLLGTMRTGPDLANIAVRQPSENWHLLHLYNPRITSPGSNMPAFPFLFRKVPVEVQVPHDALSFPPGWEVPGYSVVPSRRAKALVAYLKSLDHSHPVPEVPQ
ncbi:MAG: cbb3-type cytochrome c oxidase subunit II [Acidobacteria bacterium]|jgi:cytochrome c oxidase cbb3-type subunit 2|nr:cbb3-type cytochrome c oxidase subunit II [Acidobacteriota bacterium]